MSSSNGDNLTSIVQRVSGSWLLKLVVSVAFVGIIAARAFSQVVKDTLDATGLTLLALAVVPWLGPIFETIKVAGVEAKFRDIDRKIQSVEVTAQEAKGISADAGQKANLAVSSALDSPRDSHSAFVGGEIEALAQEYRELRQRMPSGSLRTQHMTTIVSRMMEYFKSHPNFSIEPYLNSADIGERLSAYAFYMIYNRRANVNKIVDIVINEDKTFNQYWGLQAISRLVSSSRLDFDRDSVKNKLMKMRERHPIGTDRRYVLDQIITSLSYS